MSTATQKNEAARDATTFEAGDTVRVRQEYQHLTGPDGMRHTVRHVEHLSNKSSGTLPGGRRLPSPREAAGHHQHVVLEDGRRMSGLLLELA